MNYQAELAKLKHEQTKYYDSYKEYLRLQDEIDEILEINEEGKLLDPYDLFREMNWKPNFFTRLSIKIEVYFNVLSAKLKMKLRGEKWIK